MTGQIVVEIAPSAPAGFRNRLLVAINEIVALEDLYAHRTDNKRDGTTLVEITQNERAPQIDVTGDVYELLRSVAELRGVSIRDLLVEGANAMIDKAVSDE